MSDLDPDGQARLFYLTLIGAAAVAWVVREYRGRLGAGAQNAAIWGLIFLAAMVAYGFRDRITLALDDRGIEQIGADQVRLRRADDGHFYARLAVNDTEVTFLVDTGASAIVLSPDDARAAGFDPRELAYTERASTANGPVRGAPVTLGRLDLGTLRDNDVPAIVNAVDLDESLLGMSYLQRFRRLAIEGDVMILQR